MAAANCLASLRYSNALPRTTISVDRCLDLFGDGVRVSPHDGDACAFDAAEIDSAAAHLG